jgi:hypothetical protein
MTSLDITISQQTLLKNAIKIQNSLQDIEKKHPNRTDLIESMTESVIELYQVLTDYKRLESTYNASKGIYSDLALKFLRSELLIKELETKNKELKVNFDYIAHLEQENKELNEKINILMNE